MILYLKTELFGVIRVLYAVLLIKDMTPTVFCRFRSHNSKFKNTPSVEQSSHSGA
jgi:hypothetical protein